MTFTLLKTTWFSARSYRRPMAVRELMVFPAIKQDTSFYVCPRCRVTMEREFMRYCDRCGQRLNWAHYEQARIVYSGTQKRGTGAKGPDPAVKSVIRFLFSAGR